MSPHIHAAAEQLAILVGLALLTFAAVVVLDRLRLAHHHHAKAGHARRTCTHPRLAVLPPRPCGHCGRWIA